MFPRQFPSGGEPLQPEEAEGPVDASAAEPLQRRRPWGRITAVVVVALVTIAAVAFVARQPNRPPAILTSEGDHETVALPFAAVNFTANATDPDGDALTYSWDFGDGTSASGISVTRNYTVPGWYIVLLTVTDGKGGAATNDRSLVFVHVLSRKTDGDVPSPPSRAACPVSCLAPDRGLSVLAANQSVVPVGSPVRFAANGSWMYLWTWNASTGWQLAVADASEYPSLFSFSYSWDDGSANTTGSPAAVGETAHTFASPGNYFVNLTLSAGGLIRSAGYTVRVVAGTPSLQQKDPNVFASATSRDPASLDPAVDNESAGGEVLQNVYETLVWYPPDSEAVAPLAPRLAADIPSPSNGGISPDGKNYTFRLQSGVKFHDNHNVTAASVAFTFRRVLAIHDPNASSRILEQILTNTISAYPGRDCNPAMAGVQNCTVGDWVNQTFPTRTSVPTYLTAALPPEPVWDTTPLNVSLAWAVSNSTVEPLNNTTVVFHLLRPFGGFLAFLASPVASIVSEACVAKAGGVSWGVRNAQLDHVRDCGSGPFRVSAWYRNQAVNLTRFDGYWRGPAKLREVDILPVRDVVARESMLTAGDADSAAIDRDHQWDVMNPDGTPKWPTLRIVKDRPAFGVASFGFNRRINVTAAPDPISIPSTFFDDVHIRRVFAYAFDYNAFIVNVTHDNGLQPRGPIPQGLPGYNASIRLAPFDLTQASAELQNTTYWASGFNLTLYYREGNRFEQAGLALLATGLQALHAVKGSPGAIVVRERVLDAATYVAKLDEGGLPMVLLSWTPRFADPSDSTVPFLRTGSPFPTWIRYSNTTLDALLDAAGADVNDTTRDQAYADLSARAVLDDVAYLWVFQATSFHVERAWVRNYYFNPMLQGLDYYPLLIYPLPKA